MATTDDVRNALAHLDIVEMLSALGWQTTDVAIAGDAWRAWGWRGQPVDGRIIARSPGCRVVEVQGSIARDLVLTVHRRAPLETTIWFFVEPDEVTIALARTGPAGPSMRRMSVDPERPDAMGLERLLMLDRTRIARPNDLDPAEAIAAHTCEMLDSEGLTRAFFDGFRAALQRMSESMVDGPSRASDRWHAALVVLLRLVFVYFLQREGMLDGDRRYVARRLRERPVDGANSFFRRVLRPLFFGVLNTPVEARSEAAVALGDVPFLNGGLFEPTLLELQHPEMQWTDEILGTVVEQLFERFHFTATEPSGEDDARVVNPEMLGKVFEGLMYGDERRKTGAFYTPRDVVRRMVDATIDAHLADCVQDGLDSDAALESIRILDPAVGTGAFLLEALASLRRRRQEAGLPVDYAALRRVVHNHLFGVDRNPTAVRLCELRIWLVMLSTMSQTDEVSPLPNLSHRIVAGDSLLDGIDLVRQRTGSLPAHVLTELAGLEASLERAQGSFLNSHGAEKQRLRLEIEGIERHLQLKLIAGRRATLERRLAPLRSLESSPDLFGDAMATPRQRAAAESLQAQLDVLVDAEGLVANERGSAPGFGYESRFGAAAREGFDVVVTNPPWVRARRTDDHNVLRSKYASARSELWSGADDLGICTPYGSQPDLAALFVERSLELLRPGGRLCALVPSKLFRALHASPLRRLLQQHGITGIEDLSESPARLFNATVYPGILHVRKSSPQTSVDVKVWRGARCEAFRRESKNLAPGGVPGEPWLLVPDDVHAILMRIRVRSRLLGTDPALAPRRGVFTGANDVFVRKSGGFEAELGAAVRPYVRPFLTGSALGAGRCSELLYCYDGVQPVSAVPSALARYFEHHRARLEARSDYQSSSPIWQLYRVREDTLTTKVAWRDISRLLDPYVIDDGLVPANTVYYASFEERAAALGFARWMASTPVRAWAYALAEHARGGWRRHFSWVVRMLPVPPLPAGWAHFDEAESFSLTAGESRRLDQWLHGDPVIREAA